MSGGKRETVRVRVSMGMSARNSRERVTESRETVVRARVMASGSKRETLGESEGGFEGITTDARPWQRVWENVNE